ncbi:hypothetical protein [Nonomuraea typhae]|uniref:Uncharacterized protein n=1 Tax=Nonomuraea typhae TaxID=2603600 RepID=A0ABW7YJZ2_9ACTN
MTGKQLARVASGLGYGGRGTRVISMDRERVWCGRHLLRRATALYLGLYERLGSAGDGPLPDKIAEAMRNVWRSGLHDRPDYINGTSYLERVARGS